MSFTNSKHHFIMYYLYMSAVCDAYIGDFSLTLRLTNVQFRKKKTFNLRPKSGTCSILVKTDLILIKLQCTNTFSTNIYIITLKHLIKTSSIIRTH